MKPATERRAGKLFKKFLGCGRIGEVLLKTPQIRGANIPPPHV